MPKKRRTKAQKIRASHYRQAAEASQPISKPLPAIKLPEAAPSSRPIQTKTSVTIPTSSNRSDLLLSITIFGCIIAAQFVLWALLLLTNLDETLYQRITL